MTQGSRMLGRESHTLPEGDNRGYVETTTTMAIGTHGLVTSLDMPHCSILIAHDPVLEAKALGFFVEVPRELILGWFSHDDDVDLLR